MRLHHAEVTGLRVAFPPSASVVMTVVVAVYNPNGYDVAIRAVRGQLTLARRYPMPLDFYPVPPGVWLPSDRTTLVRVPVNVPVQIAAAVLQESLFSPVVPYRFSGRADVTATRSLKLEVDNYAVDEEGVVTRAELEAAVRSIF